MDPDACVDIECREEPESLRPAQPITGGAQATPLQTQQDNGYQQVEQYCVETQHPFRLVWKEFVLYAGTEGVGEYYMLLLDDPGVMTLGQDDVIRQ